MKPEITVVLASLNEAKCIADAIESIRNQSFENWEMIIVNEFGSNDGTFNIIKHYTEIDERIFLIQNTEKLGLPASLNVGIRKARGKYIARMDADDCCVKERLLMQYKFMESNKNIDILGSNVIKDNGQVDLVISNDEIKGKVFFTCPMYHPTLFVRKSVIDKFNLYYAETAYISEDHELYLRALPYVVFFNLQEALVYYRKEINEVRRDDKHSDIVKFESKLLKQYIFKYFELNLEDYCDWALATNWGDLSINIPNEKIGDILSQRFRFLCEIENANAEKKVIDLKCFRKIIKQQWNSTIEKIYIDDYLGKIYGAYIPKADGANEISLFDEIQQKTYKDLLCDETIYDLIARKGDQIKKIISLQKKYCFGELGGILESCLCMTFRPKE